MNIYSEAYLGHLESFVSTFFPRYHYENKSPHNKHFSYCLVQTPMSHKQGIILTYQTFDGHL